MRIPSYLLIVLLFGSTLAGCLGGDQPEPDEDTTTLTTLAERHLLPFNATGPYSQVLEAGAHGILEALSVFVDVDLPVDEGGAAATNDARIHMGLFLPDIPGCDWKADDLPEDCQVPVVADIGPYYGELDLAATEPARRLGGFLIENLVPHGYAVAQVSVFGSGASNHCMDLMGHAEQLGVNAAVTWLGEAAWSNGAVGLTGRSYDGSTPWQAATFGNPALKTIVPISGLTGWTDLMWRNGTAEARAPIMHNLVYGQFGIDSAHVRMTPVQRILLDPTNADPDRLVTDLDDPDDPVTVNDADPEDAHTLCKDYAAGPAQGWGATTTGDEFAPEANDYWSERRFLDRALQNYEGSVYLIHGLQDWNVDPHMAFPTHRLLEEHGIETKGLYGQWGHMYPDRPAEHVNTPEGKGAAASRHSPRFDWAQDLLEWFDHYLKGTGDKPVLHAEVQDDQGDWRIEKTYPPLDATQRIISLKEAARTNGSAVPSGEDVWIGEELPAVSYTFAPLDETNDTRIAGNVLFHPTVIPSSAGGQLFARLEDATTGLRLGHATMDLRYADGGNELRPVTPGEPLVARMEFFAMDVVVPAGHGLRLILTQRGEDYRLAPAAGPVRLGPAEDSLLKLPVIERDDEAFFTPVPWEPCSYGPFAKRAGESARFRDRVNERYGCSFETDPSR